MKWNTLRNEEQINQIKSESNKSPVLIFKHSARCNISRTSLDRLERHWQEHDMPNVKLYFLDLISYRDISNRVAREFEVEHESPQVLIIQGEKAVYDRSHFEIDYQQIKQAIKS
jgi:bacillithiol system protein YtxJ